ncbi:hypothetical protein [Microbispora sp. GKU 823]|uniref:hypothetical protein n=1 Tax=Microbispora sp. GKU 823 TaxID=1652100 RepID=UPI0009A316F6|nr:hypothetical protein [Microbispora sp. GKU 823]OPG07933.1 hypothetical protein B1L11_29325 [Microbispora sp. GKU 823]
MLQRRLLLCLYGLGTNVGIQMVLRDPAWKKQLSAVDRRGLTALFWSHLNLYGRFELDMNRHLELDTAVAGPSQ